MSKPSYVVCRKKIYREYVKIDATNENEAIQNVMIGKPVSVLYQVFDEYIDEETWTAEIEE